ncbi:MAG: nucleotidyltransferase domain-containing protein [Flavobacteriaceae bacterium]|jgi:predicted nucleotidyltransferase|nr:nucleotidyltransferase domain-containing protein [Flavobacteriaceae bacterium]
MKRELILSKLRTLKPILQEKYPLESIALFGSYARDEASENSDVDLLVELNGRMGMNFFEMADEIEDNLGIRTEVITKRAMKDLIKEDLIYV